MIIDFVIQYVNGKQIRKVILNRINKVRIYKKKHLLLELVEVDDEKITNSYYNQEE